MIKIGRPEITLRDCVIATNDRASSSVFKAAPIAVAAEPLSALDDGAGRLDELAAHLDFLWRFACRMGVGASTAEDIAQEAFVLAASRVGSIVVGKERSFLVSVVVNMVRRERSRGARHEELSVEPAAPLSERPDERLDEERARALLDHALAALDEDLRAVFILHEIEEETMANIAQMLNLAPGTVASRLRRAREKWQIEIARLQRSPVRPPRQT